MRGNLCRFVKQLVILCAAAPLLAGAAYAATYIQMADADLMDQADVVAEMTVLDRLPTLAGASASTDYLAVVRKVIKGRVRSSSIVVRSPGGHVTNGRELFIYGAPRFAGGERVLLFLAENDRSHYSILHLGLGSFVKRGRGRSALALRNFEDSTLLDPDLNPVEDGVRNYDRFVRWLERRRRGLREEPDYFRTGVANSTSPFKLIKVSGKNLRWFNFDDSRSVNWKINNDGANNTQTQFVQALNAWSRNPVDLRLTGGTSSRAGLNRSDNTNAIVFGDPNKDIAGTFSCTTGGVLGAGGTWFNTSVTGSYKGKSYIRIREADLVINDGTECLLNRNKVGAAELYTHEVGHTLGIDHSAKSDATMAAVFHNDGRGASLRADDIKALEALHGKSSGTTPDPDPEPGPTPTSAKAPTKLKATAPKATLGKLRWRDNSDDEDMFEIWRKIENKNWKVWEMKPTNTTGFKFTDVRPGTTYTYRVRAKRGNEFSAYSNEAKVTMPIARLAAPENLEVEANSSTNGVLRWEDKTTGESKFQIERREGDGPWGFWKSADPNTTSKEFTDGVSGTTYTFRIRAKKANKVSKFSNEATVTMP